MIRLGWFMRCVMVPVIAWAIPRAPLSQLRETFDKCYRHRDEDWRRHVWALAAERAGRNVSR